MRKGSLVVVGTGILTPAHLSQESINRIETADIVHVLVPDALGLSTIKALNSNIKNLAELYFSGCNRGHSYQIMVEAILEDVRAGKKVCAIFYGHPGVFVNPSHLSIKIAREEGYEAKMLPAISAEDCLFADLGIDPGDIGCQAYEASQFMFYKQSVNNQAILILWQIGVVGDLSFKLLKPTDNGLEMLTERLLEWYPAEHLITLYEATTLPIMPSRIEIIPLKHLINAKVKTITTLYVPQIDEPSIDIEFCERWGVDFRALE